MDDLSGQEIRGYVLHERIGAGGFGAVYRATQSSVAREVAAAEIRHVPTEPTRKGWAKSIDLTQPFVPRPSRKFGQGKTRLRRKLASAVNSGVNIGAQHGSVVAARV